MPFCPIFGLFLEALNWHGLALPPCASSSGV